ncbi:MAG: 50S ribosomal protein L11 methyltransferase [Chitinophagaceae bacterium]|jgi:ribosomal protein L11 methyltransferase|nr:50S ribosomal protein L11 methyltransferase [Chitinophagaceae bacterium]
MKYYLQYRIQCKEEESREMLIAVLSELGFEGFEEETGFLIATATEGSLDEREVGDWLNESGFSFTMEKLEEQNWNAIWESDFSPVEVDDFAAVRAHFHQPVPHVRYDLIITPKMSFGTGHHATTNLMIRALKDLEVSGKSVFDFGTGTGVLAILASKMGALVVEAVDIDSWSIENARENIKMNGVESGIKLWMDDSPEQATKADIILANINKHIILQYLPVLVQKLTPQGVLVLSGLLKEDESDIEIAIKDTGLKREGISEIGNWICMIYRQTQVIVK